MFIYLNHYLKKKKEKMSGKWKLDHLYRETDHHYQRPSRCLCSITGKRLKRGDKIITGYQQGIGNGSLVEWIKKLWAIEPAHKHHSLMYEEIRMKFTDICPRPVLAVSISLLMIILGMQAPSKLAVWIPSRLLSLQWVPHIQGQMCEFNSKHCYVKIGESIGKPIILDYSTD